jgi:L-ribulose-5-phosphate 4-epimerase
LEPGVSPPGSRPVNRDAYTELRERVFEAHREILRAGLVILTFGNASGADHAAGVIAIKPSGVPYDELRPESMVIVELESGEAIDSAYRPSSDTATHLALYRRFGSLGGIVHTHSPFAAAWAQAIREIPCLGTTHADHFRGPVPVARALTDEEIQGGYEERTGDLIVETLESLGCNPLERPAVLVASHGPFTWGSDVAEAAENAIALEAVAEIAFRTVQLRPEAKPISDGLLERHFLRKHGPSAYYGQDR